MRSRLELTPLVIHLLLSACSSDALDADRPFTAFPDPSATTTVSLHQAPTAKVTPPGLHARGVVNRGRTRPGRSRGERSRPMLSGKGVRAA
jgi:hypothetical protein